MATDRTRPVDWSKRKYPWTPTKRDKTVTQSFAAIRSGLLPIVDHGIYRIVDTRMKDGLKDFIEADRRTILSDDAPVRQRLTKKKAKIEKKTPKRAGLKKMSRTMLDSTPDEGSLR